MIGDVNLFLSEEDDESDNDEIEINQRQNLPQSTDEQPTNEQSTYTKLSQAELDLMIAAPTHRSKNLGTEIALTMMHYGATHLNIRRYFVKVHETNVASLKLFKDKLGFEECAYVKCFGEYELECKFDTASDMVCWIERRWEWWCKEMSRRRSDDVELSSNEDEQSCRLYDVHNCPLDS